MDKKRALRSIHRRTLRIEEGIKEREQLIEECTRVKETEHLGVLLSSNLSSIKEKASSIRVYDWLQNKEIDIPLNPEKPAKEQPLLYFRKMKKQKKALTPLKKSLEHLNKELSFWKKKLQFLESTDDEIAIQECLEALFQKRKLPKTEEKNSKKLSYYEFRSASGCRILVGKDAKSSSYITFQKARGDELWLHIQGMSGPHVILKKNHKGEMDSEAILDAAHLAVYMSKARGEPYKEHVVSVTERKFVHHLGKTAEGTVSLSKFREMVIMINPERINAIKNRH
jgi:predicted ribosome quality control (RQC) complex YloA/Tae2 family protein